MVDEDLRAWHAGQSVWKGERDINSVSIGIEIHNPGHEHGYTDFPPRADDGRHGARSRHRRAARNPA